MCFLFIVCNCLIHGLITKCLILKEDCSNTITNFSSKYFTFLALINIFIIMIIFLINNLLYNVKILQTEIDKYKNCNNVALNENNDVNLESVSTMSDPTILPPTYNQLFPDQS